MLRLRTTVALGLVVVIGGACQPDRKSVEIANPCSEPITVRIWDAPRPRATDVTFHTDVEVPPVALATAEGAVSDVGDEGFAAEILDGPGAGEVILVAGDQDRSVVLPADLCVG